MTALFTMILLQNVYNVASEADAYLDATVKLLTTVAVPLASLYFSWKMNSKTQELQRDLNNSTGQLQRDLAKLNIDEKRIEEKRKDISKKLNEFYAPLQQYLNKSYELSKVLYKGKPEGFRTLTYLLDPQQIYSGDNKPVVLTNNDKLILEEIIKIGKKIEELIIDKSGLVDDTRLSYKYIPSETYTDVKFDGSNGLLAILGSHLLVIRYAYEKKIVGQAEEYKDYVYPREINYIIKENIDRLSEELNNLLSISNLA